MVMKVNLYGTFNVIRLVVEIMTKQAPVNEDGERGGMKGKNSEFHPINNYYCHIVAF